MNNLQFYIIITPGSLRYLKFALWSLQKRTDMEIFLVANGLKNDEYDALRCFSTQINCNYKRLESKTILSHGACLDVLINQHDLPWFCFCDADIISTDSNAEDIHINNNIKALSSCDAMFWDESEVKGVLGRCNRWPDGSQNLASFFGIYQTNTIKFLIDKYNIGFNNISYQEIKSRRLKSMLKQKGIGESSRKLDTGKALTAALELESQPFKHTKIPSLLHIGGLSSWMLNGDKNLIHTKYHLTDYDLYKLAPKESWLYNLNAQKDPENIIFYLRRQQRLSAARYCFQLISYYVDNTPRPVHNLSNKSFSLKIDKIESALKQYYSKKS